MSNKNTSNESIPLYESPNLKDWQKQIKELTSTPEYQNMSANLMLKSIDKYMNVNTFTLPDIPTAEERLGFLTKKLDSMNSELEAQTDSICKIQYENMKLNAQIEVLNKTIDSDKDELKELQKANAELKTVNKNLENNNRHYWRNTGLISLGVAIISYILGLYSTEVKSLLLSILHLLQ